MATRRWSTWLAVVVVVGLIVGCSSPDDEPEQEDFDPWQRPLEGQWARGDLHAHSAGASNDAAPESTPERIAEVAQKRELDFVVLTDHSNSTQDPWTMDEDPELYNTGPDFPHWELAKQLWDGSFMMVQGSELSPTSDDNSEPTGHIGCIPRSLTDFDPDHAFTDRPRGEVPGGDALQQALDVGCFAILNHPFGPVPWISYDWTDYGYEGMEVWNGGAGFNDFDELAVKGWACDLSQDRQITPIGASDNHDVEVEPPGSLSQPPLGYPVTWVWVEEFEWGHIIDGLDAGMVGITDSYDPFEIDVFEPDGRWLAMAGGEFEAEDERVVRLRGVRKSGDEERQLKLMRVSEGSCDDQRQEGEIEAPDPNWEIVEEWALDGEGEFEKKVEVEVEQGDVFFGWMRPQTLGAHEEDVAISGAVYTAE